MSRRSGLLPLATVAHLALCAPAPAAFVALGYDQWKPSLATPIYLTAGTWQLDPALNPDGRWGGFSAFFSGGRWDSWTWNVAVWSTDSDANHAVPPYGALTGGLDVNQIAWFRTNFYGNPSVYDPAGATTAFNAALAGDRMPGMWGYLEIGMPYRFTVAMAGTYFFGIYDVDIHNNVGGVFFNLTEVPAPAAAPLLALAGLLTRSRRRACS